MMTEDKIYIHRFGPTSLVDQVSFTGVERTKIQTILREFEGFGRLNSIEGIYQASEEVHRALMSLDAFEAVDIVIDESSQVCIISRRHCGSDDSVTYNQLKCRMMGKFRYELQRQSSACSVSMQGRMSRGLREL